MTLYFFSFSSQIKSFGQFLSQVLYDDGDVEVLRLDKERWELVEKDHKSEKVQTILCFIIFLLFFFTCLA